ncbi:MAG TPA: acyltransferase [Rhodocyclaceae bacterium]|jgi:peptidoglycan/LPS O-acetylase OafA/YrhL
MNPAASATSRLPLADALKAIAAQIIVLHHLIHYGPMSNAAYDLAPWLFDWMDQYGRMAVQVFLVVGGYLAARTLMPAATPVNWDILPQIGRRYLRLVIPYTAALVLAIGLSAVARQLMDHDSISAPATAPQVTAHLLLVQGLLNYESLSAGVWYLAIDFQLYSLLALMLWLPRKTGWSRLALPAIMILMTVSLFHFNLNSDWDNWAPYFFGSYAIGALAYWATVRNRNWSCAAGITLVCGLALLMDFRWRILLALATALILLAPLRMVWFEKLITSRPIAFLSQISFATFLVHFPVCLVVNGLFVRFELTHPVANAFGVVLAWLASLAMGALFYRVIGQGLMPRLGMARRVKPKAAPALPVNTSKQTG